MQRIQWVFAVTKDHELTRQTLPLDNHTIENYRSVIVRDSSRTTAPLSSRLFSKQPVFSVPTLQEKIRAQVLGLGVGFLPRHSIIQLLADRKLVELPTAQGTNEAPVHMIWKTNNKGRALRWFIATLSEKIERDSAQI